MDFPADPWSRSSSPYGYKLYINDGSGEVQVFVHVSAGFDKAVLGPDARPLHDCHMRPRGSWLWSNPEKNALAL